MSELLAAAVAQSLPVSFIAILALGFFLGMRHATDADHVIAVSTIVTRERSVASAALIGVLWGAGHTLTILVVGTAIIVFSFVVSPRLGLTMEFSVGLMLMLLGALNILGFRRSVEEYVHQHNDSDTPHSHVAGELRTAGVGSHPDRQHTHRIPLTVLDRFCGTLTVYQMCRPLMIGIVHGLAGSAAVALLVLTTIHNSHWAVAYLLIFGLGTIVGMMVITVALGSTIAYAGRRSESLTRYLATASGWISLAFGLFIAYQIGISKGLFTGHPHWMPH
jgi:high-affinity nickel-transport protein